MSQKYVWYECIYPGFSDSFYVNVNTGNVFKKIPLDDPDASSVKELSIEQDVTEWDCFYISFRSFSYFFLTITVVKLRSPLLRLLNKK